jgi:RNA polymerase sigma-70 factor (ECF subfamily)
MEDADSRQPFPQIDLLARVRDRAGAAGGIAIATREPSLADRTQVADYDLVRWAAKGDTSAYGELVSRYQRGVYGIVSRMVRNPEDVDDLVQDVFVLAYRSIGRFRGDSSFGTWLHSIAVNTTIKHLRKMKSRPMVSIDDPESGIEEALAASGNPSPSESAEDGEQRRAVRRAVDELPEKHRVVVVLRYFEDYSCDEIANILNCSVGTVWSRLHYACRKLRGQLGWLETA